MLYAGPVSGIVLMMRKPLVPRFLLLAAVYVVIFILLIQFQFAKRSNFTQRVGNIVVSGHYDDVPAGTVLAPNVYRVKGNVSVFFGGMEFLVFQDEDRGSFLSGSAGDTAARPKTMTITDTGAFFTLAEGPELSFITQYSGGAQELLIRISLGTEEYNALTLPFRPLRTSRVREENGRIIYSADGVSYTFPEQPPEVLSVEKRSIRLETDTASISYRAIPQRSGIQPADFVVPAAAESARYEEALTLWRDTSYSAWNRAVAAGSLDPANAGEVLNAYMGESLRRGTYRAAAAAVSALYIPDQAGYEASAYVGKLDGALRSLAAAERERYTRVARLLNDRSFDFLREFHVVEYLGIRGYGNLLEDISDMLRGLDPASLTLIQAAGLLEGEEDWSRRRPDRENPFGRFSDQAAYVITDSLKKNPFTGYVLAFSGNEADTELNLRLGSTLARSSDKNLRDLGRSLILSVLSMADQSGSVPRTMVTTAQDFVKKNGTGSVHSARMYRICGSGEYYARALAGLDQRTAGMPQGIWAWTAASAMTVLQSASATDITVNFSAGETHYLMIRGIRSFVRLQIYGMDYPSDPQFERYDSSGWTYSASEQTLLLKLRHRASAEHIVLLQTPAESEAAE